MGQVPKTQTFKITRTRTSELTIPRNNFSILENPGMATSPVSCGHPAKTNGLGPRCALNKDGARSGFVPGVPFPESASRPLSPPRPCPYPRWRPPRFPLPGFRPGSGGFTWPRPFRRKPRGQDGGGHGLNPAAPPRPSRPEGAVQGAGLDRAVPGSSLPRGIPGDTPAQDKAGPRLPARHGLGPPGRLQVGRARERAAGGQGGVGTPGGDRAGLGADVGMLWAQGQGVCVCVRVVRRGSHGLCH